MGGTFFEKIYDKRPELKKSIGRYVIERVVCYLFIS